MRDLLLVVGHLLQLGDEGGFDITIAEKIPARFTDDASGLSLTASRSPNAERSSTCSTPLAPSAARHPVAKSPSGCSLPSVATILPACDACSATTGAA